MTIKEANEELKRKFGKNITVKITEYTEDDGSIWYEYCGVLTDGKSFKNIEEVYTAASDYLKSL